MQTVLSDVRTVEEDAARAYDRFFVDNGYLEKVQGWGWGSGIHSGNEKGSGQSRDHKQIVQYHADPLTKYLPSGSGMVLDNLFVITGLSCSFSVAR